MYLSSFVFVVCSSKSNTATIVKRTGCEGEHPFIELPHHNPVQQTAPDAMHTVKDAVCNIYDLIAGKDNTVKCKWKLRGSFGLSTATLKKKICHKNPIVSYSLSTSDLRLANNRALEIKTSLLVDFTPGQFALTQQL